MVAIHAEILKTLRKRSGLTQEALAKEGKVGIATIKRIEAAEETYEARSLVAERLARALGVAVEALSGEPLDDREGESKLRFFGYRPIKGAVRAENALSFDMVEHLYGVPADRQIAVAPLLFALAAEGSLAWRKEKLTVIDEAVKRLATLAESAGHLSFAHADRVGEGSDWERESIERRDLFGRHASDRAYDQGYDPNTHNPFVDYLRMFAKRIESDDIQIEIDLDIFNELPRYGIGERIIEEATGDDRRAYYAMSRGHVRVRDIPQGLLGEERKDERIAWLISHIPEKEREALEEEERELEALRKKLNIDLSATADPAPSPESC